MELPADAPQLPKTHRGHLARFGHEWRAFLAAAHTLCGLDTAGLEEAWRFVFHLDSLRGLRLDFISASAGHERALALALARFRLPGLRARWERLLRLSHYTSLQQVLPWAWEINPAPVPPGAVIHGLDLCQWSDLPRWHGRRAFLLLGRDFPPGGLRLDANVSVESWRAAIAQAAPSVPEPPLLVEISARQGAVVEAVYRDLENRIELGGFTEKTLDDIAA